jgi:hypothetical protein
VGGGGAPTPQPDQLPNESNTFGAFAASAFVFVVGALATSAASELLGMLTIGQAQGGLNRGGLD